MKAAKPDSSCSWAPALPRPRRSSSRNSSAGPDLMRATSCQWIFEAPTIREFWIACAKRSKGFSNKPKPSRILRHEEIVLGHEASAL